MAQVVLGQLAAQLIEDRLVAGAGRLQVALQGAQGHVEPRGDPFLARQAVAEHLAQHRADPQRQRLVVLQAVEQPHGVRLQGAQQAGIGLAQRQTQILQRGQQRAVRLLEQHRTAEHPLVVLDPAARRQRMLELYATGGMLHAGDPAPVMQPGRQHVLDQVSAHRLVRMPAVPAQAHLAILLLDVTGAHVADQPLVGQDARHRLAEGGAVHGDVAEHAPRAGLHVARRMQAEQRIGGLPQQVFEQPLVLFAGHPLAVVGQALGAQPGGLPRRRAVQAEGLGMAQVLEQDGNRRIAECLHARRVFGSIGECAWPDRTVTATRGWLV